MLPKIVIFFLFAFIEGSLVVSSPTSQSVLIDWLSDFFTVVEYPVQGYIPPAILTEMHFDAKQCTIDVTYLPPGQITLAIGHARINCRLLDTGEDVSITISAEDIGLFVSKNETAVSHLKSSICILDVDSCDVSVNLREKPTPILDVSLGVQLVRIRCTNDAIMLLIEFATTIPPQHRLGSVSSTRETSVQRDNISEQQVSDDVVPDLADAMAELEMEQAAEEVDHDGDESKANERNRKSKVRKLEYLITT